MLFLLMSGKWGRQVKDVLLINMINFLFFPDNNEVKHPTEKQKHSASITSLLEEDI